MKKLLLATLLAGAAMSASAQYTAKNKIANTFSLSRTAFSTSDNFGYESPITYGIKGGANFASAQLSADGTSATYNTGKLTNFAVGAFVNVAVNNNFSFQPGLYYSGKGFKIDEISLDLDLGSGIAGSSTTTIKTNIAYIQIPVNFLFTANNNAGQLFIGGGPFAAAAINAKANVKGDVSASFGGQTVTEHVDESQDLEIGSDADIKRLDYGVTGMAGFKFRNGFLISANYDLGLANISGGSDDEGKLKTRVIGVSVGFSF